MSKSQIIERHSIESILASVRATCEKHPDALEQLKLEFAKFDEKSEGVLDPASFKICILLKSEFSLTIGDAEAIARHISKDGSQQRIDYFAFLKAVKSAQSSSIQTTKGTHHSFDLSQFLSTLSAVLSSYESPSAFIKIIHSKFPIPTHNRSATSTSEKISLQQMSDFLKAEQLQKEDWNRISEYVSQIDFDKDGWISAIDIEWFLKHGRFIDHIPRYFGGSTSANTTSYHAPSQSPLDAASFLPKSSYDTTKLTRRVKRNSMSCTSLKHSSQSLLAAAVAKPFPTIPLSEEQISKILRSLRKSLEASRITFKRFFEILDSDRTGMISPSNFSKNIKQFISLSEATVDGLFAYIDKNKIGMIDRGCLMAVLEKSVRNPEAPNVTEDNWEWQEEISQKIYSWYTQNRFPSEIDAFRLFDFDFQGYITKENLRRFLREILRIGEHELTEGRVNRLYKVLDYYKSGKVSALDFTNFIRIQHQLSASTSSIKDPISQNSRSPANHSKWEWKEQAKQQLGLALSRTFSSTLASFESISNNKDKITFDMFSSWIDKQNALDGFDLTSVLTRELFAFLDPHKKGYLAESDWLSAFRSIDWRAQLASELKKVINDCFKSGPDIKKGFEFFSLRNNNDRQGQSAISEDSGQAGTIPTITLKSFLFGLEQLFPRRFPKKDIEEVWVNKMVKSQVNQSQKVAGIDYNSYLGFLGKVQNSSQFLHSRSISQHSIATTMLPTTNKSELPTVSSNNSSTQPAHKQNNSQDLFRPFAPMQASKQATQVQVNSSMNMNPGAASTHTSSFSNTGQFFNQSRKRLVQERDRNKRQSYDTLVPLANLSSLLRPSELQNNNHTSPSRVAKLSKNNTTTILKQVDESNNSNNLSSSTLLRNRNSETSPYIISNRGSSVGQTRQFVGGSGDQLSGDPFGQMQKQVMSSHSSNEVEATFRAEALGNTDYITKHSLCKVLRGLNVQVSNALLNAILERVVPEAGKISIRALMRVAFTPTQTDLLVKDRAQQKIKVLSSDIYTHLFSPIEAFRRFNTSNNGKLSLGEFRKLMEYLNEKSKREKESAFVLKDLFDFFDKDSDGYIGLQDWIGLIPTLQVRDISAVESFRKLPLGRDQYYEQIKSQVQGRQYVRNSKIGAIAASNRDEGSCSEQNLGGVKSLFGDVVKYFEQQKQIPIKNSVSTSPLTGKQKAVSAKDYDTVTKVIQRNRKYFMETFSAYNDSNIAITEDLAKSVFTKVLRSNGVVAPFAEIFPELMGFAVRRDGIVDYKLLLDIFKDRLI